MKIGYVLSQIVLIFDKIFLVIKVSNLKYFQKEILECPILATDEP